MRRTRWWFVSHPGRALATAGVVLFALSPHGTAVFAQSSPSYDMSAHVVNAGGHPAQAIVLSSGSYLLSLDAVGDGLDAPFLGSASYSMGVGFVAPYPPPGEVLGLRLLADKTTLAWSPDSSVGHYDVYRDLVGQLPGSYGLCWASRVTAVSIVDPDLPPSQPPGRGFFYLVTASNLLDEEGTKGFDSQHAERANPAPCP